MNKKGFEIAGKFYPGVFNLNVMANLQEKFGSVNVLDTLDGKEPNISAIRFLITNMINEAEKLSDKEEKRLYTEEEIGSMITMEELLKSQEKAKEIIVKDTKSKEEKN